MASRPAIATDRYGRDHKTERQRWQPLIDQDIIDCHAIDCLEPDRHIAVGTPWHLGHDPTGTTWTGPEHPRCNSADGGTRSHARQPASLNW